MIRIPKWLFDTGALRRFFLGVYISRFRSFLFSALLTLSPAADLSAQGILDQIPVNTWYAYPNLNLQNELPVPEGWGSVGTACAWCNYDFSYYGIGLPAFGGHADWEGKANLTTGGIAVISGTFLPKKQYLGSTGWATNYNGDRTYVDLSIREPGVQFYNIPSGRTPILPADRHGYIASVITHPTATHPQGAYVTLLLSSPSSGQSAGNLVVIASIPPTGQEDKMAGVAYPIPGFTYENRYENGFTMGYMVYDRERDRVYATSSTGKNNVFEINPNTGEITNRGGNASFVNQSYNAGVGIASGSRYLLWGPDGQLRVANLNQSGSVVWNPQATSGSAPSMWRVRATESPLYPNEVLVWNGGTNIYALNTSTWVWRTITPASGNSVNPGGPGGAGTNGRFNCWNAYGMCFGALLNDGDVRGGGPDFLGYRLGSPTSGPIPTPAPTGSPGPSGTPTVPPPDTTAPSIPAGLNATVVSSSQINISWSASTDNVGVTSYDVYRNGALVGNVSSTTYQSTGLTPSTSYSFTVRAKDAAGNTSASSSAASATTQSPPLTADTTAPTVPGGLSGAAPTSTAVTLSWSASSDPAVSGAQTSGVLGYRIYRGVTQINTATGTSYSDTGRSPGTSYSYTVAAYDGAGNVSAQSSTVNVTTPAAGPTPPPPTPTGGVITTFTLTSPTTQTSAPFTIGVVFKKGDIIDSLVLSIPRYQVDVTRRWNDGSVKHAIVSGHTDLTANTPKIISVSAGGTTSGSNLTVADIQAANPQISVQLGGSGTVNLSSLISQAPFRVWLSGPEVVEAHYRQEVNQHLYVWIMVRYYKDGRIWAQVVSGNGYLDRRAGDTGYTATVVANGATVYNSSMTHYGNTRWVKDFWIGGDPQITPKHDTDYLMATKLVPNYMPDYLNRSFNQTKLNTALNALCQVYVYGNPCNLTPSMGTAGFQPGIGLLPNWEALFFVTDGDSRAYRSILANAAAINSYETDFPDSNTKVTFIPSDRPRWGITGENGGGGTTTDSAGGNTFYGSHHPSEGYLAYLLTGNRFYLDTIQNISGTTYLLESPGYLPFVYRNLTLGGQFYPAVSYNGTESNGPGTERVMAGPQRKQAWAFRTIGQAVAITPESEPFEDDYEQLIKNNLDYWNWTIEIPGHSPIGYLYSYNANGVLQDGLGAGFMVAFQAAVLGYITDLDSLADVYKPLLVKIRDFMYRIPIGLLGAGGQDNHCFTRAGAYNYVISDYTSLDTRTYYRNWGEIDRATYGSAAASCGNTLTGSSGSHPTLANTGYWGNILPSISYAVDHGVPGAKEAWSRLSNASNFRSELLASEFETFPVWAIFPRNPEGVTPSPLPTPTVDTTAPVIPSGLSASAVSQSQINLSWSASSDNVGVVGYRVYRSGSQIATVTGTSYQNTGLSAGTTYSFTVAAYDAAGNASAQSAGSSATTQAAPTPNPTVVPSPTVNPTPPPPSPTVNPTPNPSISPVPSPTAGAGRPPFQSGDLVVVVGGGVNVRSGASSSATLLGAQPDGTQGTVVGGPVASSGYFFWTQVVWDNGLGGTSPAPWSVGDDRLSYIGTAPTPSVSPVPSTSPNPTGVPGGRTLSANPSDYQGIISAALPGDTINLAAGDYNGQLYLRNLHGNADAYITIAGPATAPRAVFHANSCCNTINIGPASFIKLNNLEIDGDGNAASFAVSADGWSAKIEIENFYIHDQAVRDNGTVVGDNQDVAISTKAPALHWVIRGNLLDRPGLGMYLGNSDQTKDFVGGLIENNTIIDSMGYGIQIKAQGGGRDPEFSTEPRLAAGDERTVIRNNVIIRSRDYGVAARPNLLVGGFPDSGPGANDRYEIYGNFLYQNPNECLAQLTGRVAFYSNVGVNTQGGCGVLLTAHDGRPVRDSSAFSNTIIAGGAGININGAAAGTEQLVRGNAVFAATPLQGGSQSDNVTGSVAGASTHLNDPSGTLGSTLNLFPKVGQLTGSLLDLTPFQSFTDYDRDFNGAVRDRTYRGAYTGSGANPGWTLSAGPKSSGPATPPDIAPGAPTGLTVTLGP